MEDLFRLVELPYWGEAPLWQIVAAGGALLLGLVVLLFVFLPLARAFAAMLQLAVAVAILGGGYYGLRHLEDANRLAERRALDDRVAALFGQTIQPGSILACIDGSPQPAMFEACERTVFFEPQRVASAVAIVTQRLAFLTDALEFAAQRDESYLSRIESLRRAVESDPYGLVAHVLVTEYQCTPETCDLFDLFRDPERVKENMRVRRFEAYMVKHATTWRGTTGQASANPASGTEGDTPVAGMSLGERVLPGVEILDPPPRGEFVAPAAATSPVLTPPPPDTFSETPAPVTTPTPPAASAPASPPPRLAPPSAAAKSKAKGSAVRRVTEPVAGLPRVVPSEFLRKLEEQDEEEEAAPAPRTVEPAALAPQR